MQNSRFVLPTIPILFLSALTGCQRTVSHVPPTKPVKFEVYLAEDKAAEGLVAVSDPYMDREVFRQATPLLTNADVADAYVRKDEQGEPAVVIRRDKRAAKRNRIATSVHIGKPVVIVLDGKVLMVSAIQETISQDMKFTGRFTATQAEQIALGIMIF